MPEYLPTVLVFAALIAAGWTLIGLLRDRGPDRILLGALALIEVGLLAQAVLGIAGLAGAEREVASVTFVGYLLGILLVLPIAAAWALAERSRWGNAVLLVGCLAIPVMIVRLQQVWDGQGV
ncbi:hypothetical protein H0B56_08660 [Haloechinothrix sp. YIM 98757]|uniref:Integral membrane protein n=1 Tax=Haloechinothrix aidingensis TaxID=2752311 RepID=A0A837ZY91_9PSEU|nr:hypothetical protein [Haloechinothrix aidingensis]